MKTATYFNWTLTAVAALSAVLSAYFAWKAHTWTLSVQRPNLNAVVELFASRTNNGIRIMNGGMSPARIHQYKLTDGLTEKETKWAAQDLTSLGWSEGQIVQIPMSNGSALSGGQYHPIISIDRTIGQTDISVLERLFNGINVEICYCDMADENCWKYHWKYTDRNDHISRELSVPRCV